MVLQESSLQWYRALFITLEAAIFAFAYFLIQNQLVGGWIHTVGWIPIGLGMFGCIAWMIICTQRTNLVDKQRHEIEKLIIKSDLNRWYDVYRDIDKDFRRRIAQAGYFYEKIGLFFYRNHPQ